MKAIRRVALATVMAGMLSLSACGDDAGGGVCLADFGILVECFDCWSEEDCADVGSGGTWNSAVTSCAELGYTHPTSNRCGYTR